RLKVAITLIPNPHLETPNYSINRLRQDDLSGDVLQASYKLVEKPVEEKPLSAAQEQQKATRAQAVVQGITPTQPAPMKVEEAKPSFLGKLFGWFKKLGEEEKPKAKPAASRPRSGQRPERSEGGGNKRRERGGRGERGERGERSEGGNRERNKPAEGATKPQEAREPREPRQPRPPRPPRAAPTPQAEEKPVLETLVAAPAELAEEGAAREGARRRGRRGGRRERERRDNVAQTTEVSASTGEAAVQPAAPAGTAPARLKPTEYVAYPDGYVPPVKPTEYIAYPEGHVPAKPVHAAPQPVVAAAPAAATGGEGLVQIETDLSKASVVALYLLPAMNAKLIPQFAKMKPGSRIVAQNTSQVAGYQGERLMNYGMLNNFS
ncbi:MAG: hypothetical protein HYZ46_01855, partial [Nitrosomonadales bacterium]|nr:hypothetical protein [Nitrosomonadales bacterium]